MTHVTGQVLTASTFPARRVFLVTWWLDDMGGMEEHFTTLACALQRAGVEVAVFLEVPLSDSNQYGKRLRNAGIAVTTPPRVLGRLGIWAERVPINSRKQLRALAAKARSKLVRDQGKRAGTLRHIGAGPLGALLLERMEAEQERKRPDVVHVHGMRLGQPWVLAWAASRQIPAAYTEHSTIADWGGPFDMSTVGLVERTGTALACVAESGAASLARLLPNANILVTRHMMTSGKDVNRVRQQVAPNRLEICCISRLEPHKGIDVLLRALTKVESPVCVTVAGTGSQLQHLRRTAQQLGVAEKVEFRGLLDRQELDELVRNSSVMVLPSLTEALPMSIVEALSAGLPVIAAAVGGIPEIVTDGKNGILCRPGDADELAAAIEKLASDRALLARLSAGALEWLESSEYKQEYVMKQLAALYVHAGVKGGSVANG